MVAVVRARRPNIASREPTAIKENKELLITKRSSILRLITMLIFSMAICSVQAQDEVQPQLKKSFLQKLVHYLDSSNVMGTDPDYIGLPEKKWCVTLNSSHNQISLNLDSHLEASADDQFDFNLRIPPPVTNSVGASICYRGWGGGYGFSLTGNKGINMSFNIATPMNGVNIRWRRFNFDEPQIGASNIISEGIKKEGMPLTTTELNKSMKIESFVFDGYWIFNHKRFALAAPYGQSVIQKRSAGSFIAGLMVYYQKFDMSQRENAIISLFHNGLGKLKIYQGSLGAGYTYNWVPTPGLVINAVAMPVVSVVNYIKAETYTYKLDDEYEKMFEEENEQFSAGDLFSHITLDKKNSDSDWGKIRLNLDVRASITYWIRNWFITGMGQIHSFSSTYDETTIRMSEWDIKAAIGFTF